MAGQDPQDGRVQKILDRCEITRRMLLPTLKQIITDNTPISFPSMTLKEFLKKEKVSHTHTAKSTSDSTNMQSMVKNITEIIQK